MEPSFEQASAFLDQALIFYAGGQMDEASQQIASAAAMLHEIQLAPAEQEPGPAELRPVVVEFPGVTVYEMPLALTGETTAPAALPPGPAELESKPSLAVAA